MIGCRITAKLARVRQVKVRKIDASKTTWSGGTEQSTSHGKYYSGITTQDKNLRMA